MGKVIKRGGGVSPDVNDFSGESGSAVKRAPIIERAKFEARAEAQSIRERASAEAERLLEQARCEAEQLKEQARTQGYKQGYQEGRDEAAAELSEIVTRVSVRMQQIEAQAVPQLRDLAVTIARKILGRELEFHPEAVVSVVKQALAEKARQRREISLRLHPDDLAFVRENKPDIIEVLSRAKEIGIREDPDVAPHGVIIETDAGTIDAQLETQLAAFERVLKDTG